jgi:hypothetical protein
MKTALNFAKQRQQGSILAYFILLLVIVGAIASVGAYVAQTTNVSRRRGSMVSARQYAESAAVIAAVDLNTAYTNVGATSFPLNLAVLSPRYTLNAPLSTFQQRVYERTISDPFINQTVKAQISVPNSSSASTAKIVTSAVVGGVTNTTTLNLQMLLNFGGAIVSVNSGDGSSAVAKSDAEAGDVVVSGGGAGVTLIVDGGNGLAISANGRVNVSPSATVPPGTISMTNQGSANQIADYTSQGTANSLFDFNRYIAVADLTTNSYNTNVLHNNHFTNVNAFANAMRIATNHTLEGIIVVDLHKTSTPVDPNWQKAGDASMFPNGINIHGTLFYNFGPEFGPLDKFVMNADLNINAADLSGLVTTNRASYASGYPPVYTDPTRNPTNINTWAAVPIPYPTFSPADDLPALMYSTGEVDIHGPANVCGVCYTPSYMEIENKGSSGSIQYFRGMMIMGNGIFYENTQAGNISIITFDRKAVDNLATALSSGKSVKVAYWQ